MHLLCSKSLNHVMSNVVLQLTHSHSLDLEKNILALYIPWVASDLNYACDNVRKLLLPSQTLSPECQACSEFFSSLLGRVPPATINAHIKKHDTYKLNR